MAQRVPGQPKRELELEALVGILKLKKGDSHSLQRVAEKIKKSPLQTKILRELYKITQFPSTTTRNDLSLLIDIPQRSIQVWFQNTRQHKKKSMGNNQVPGSAEAGKLCEQEPEDVPIHVLMEIISYSKASMKEKIYFRKIQSEE